MGYFKISVKSKHNVSDIERKKYIRCLYDDFEGHKLGFFSKFNNACGFKNVVTDYVSHYPVCEPPKVETPDEYLAPGDLLVRHPMIVNLTNKGLYTFYIEDGYEKHPISEYSYSHKDIAVKFYKFLRKIFPDLVIEFDFVESKKIPLLSRVISYFYISMEADVQYTVECSMPRLLTDDEMNRLYSILKNIVPYSFIIDQYYCETCYNWHKDSPYHIEILYQK